MVNSAELSASRTIRLALKELREILRDRRTITTLVLMPLLVYPLLGVMVKRGLLSSLETADGTSYRVVFETADEVELLNRQLLQGAALLPSDSTSKGLVNPLAQLAASDTDEVSALQFFRSRAGSTLEAAVRSGQADLGMRMTESSDAPRDRQGSVSWTLIHCPEYQLSAEARSYVLRRLKALNDQHIRNTLKLHEIEVLLPAQISENSVATESGSPSPLVTFIPLVLVLMTMTGAVYPAIDLTAGERERGTMEILIAAPVSRMTLLAGKFVAVLVVALLTASVNMLSMFATLFTLGLDRAVLGGSGLRIIPLVMLMMVVFAGFFSAVLLSITSVARSFKEAQAYLIPLMLISLTPGMFSLMPDLQMGTLLAVTPLVNIVLTGRDLLQSHFNLPMFTIVILSTAFYGVLALAVAARIFGSDSVLYGSTGSWTTLLNQSGRPQLSAPPAAGILSLAIVFPLFIIVGSIPGRLADVYALDLSHVLLLNIIVFVAVFVVVPTVVLRLSNASFSSGLSLNAKVPLLSILCSVLFGISMWAVLYEVSLVVGIASRADTLRRALEPLVENLRQTPLSVKLSALAVAPAICEELFFRGFLQTSLRQRYSATAAVTASALLFGLFHIFVRDHLFIERMIPSTVMGIILGIMLERSGSVLPGMLLHVFHNGLLLCTVHYQTSLEQLVGFGLEQRRHLPPVWLAVTVALAFLAGLLLWRTKPVRSRRAWHC